MFLQKLVLMVLLLLSQSVLATTVPFGMLDNSLSIKVNGKIEGATYEACHQVLEKLSMQCEPVFYDNYLRMLRDLERGAIAMTSGYKVNGSSPLLSKDFECSDSVYFKDDFGIYVLSDSDIHLSDMADLKGYRISIQRTINDSFVPNRDANTVTLHRDRELIYRFMAAGRADMVIQASSSIAAWRRMGRRDFRRLFKVGDVAYNIFF